MRNRIRLAGAALLLGYAANLSPQIVEPKVTTLGLDDVRVLSMAEGHSLQRINGPLAGIAWQEWEAGVKLEQHNHLNQAVLVVVEGRMKLTSGDREFVLGPRQFAIIPSYVVHGFEALEDSITIGAYSPSFPPD